MISALAYFRIIRYNMREKIERKKAMKKLLSLLLALALVLSLSGCRAANNTPADPTDAALATDATLATAPTETTGVTEATGATDATEAPTVLPTEAPTEAPTEVPTEAPTEKPTQVPTEAPTEAPTEQPTEKPTEPQQEAYYAVIDQKNVGGKFYFTGRMDGNYLATSQNASDAAVIYRETAAGGFKLYFLNGSAKTYLEIYDRGSGKAGVRLVSDTNVVYTLDQKANTPITVIGSYTFYLGAYNQFTTISASNTSYISGSNASKVDISQFPMRLVEPGAAEDDVSPTTPPGGDSSLLDPNGSYDTKEEVALYIHLYGKLPSNFMTKSQAEAQGWSGSGSLSRVLPGKCIGGDIFRNREGLLPKKSGRTYYECDIGTMYSGSRGAKRIVFSNDGLVYYTHDHYESFELLYGTP